MRVGAAHAGGQHVEKGVVVVPALDEDQLRATRQRLLQARPVTRDRKPRVVRRENEPDDPLGPCGEGRLHRLGDPGSPVLHPDADGQAERAFERRDRKSTRLNSSHTVNSYAVFCLKKKKGAPCRPPTDYLLAAGRRYRRRRPTGPWTLRERCTGVLGGVFFFKEPATTEIYTLSLHDALPI